MEKLLLKQLIKRLKVKVMLMLMPKLRQKQRPRQKLKLKSLKPTKQTLLYFQDFLVTRKVKKDKMKLLPKKRMIARIWKVLLMNLMFMTKI
mmetsp:Transcript_113470/g.156845  ORF Transcript_113470/g.156845 Transcript_113470/m.156845 type:complete len:91 (+) Transcript_113470:296-568(+)